MKIETIYANDEALLLEALHKRDPDAFAYLFNLYSDKIYRLSVSLLKDDVAAEGVVQDAFLRLIERLDQFEGRANLGTWLYRIAYNLSIDRLRKRKPELVLEDEPGDGRYPAPSHLIDWKQWPEQLLTDAEVTAEAQEHLATCENCRVVLDSTQQTIFLFHEQGKRTIPAKRRESLFNQLQDAFLKSKVV